MKKNIIRLLSVAFVAFLFAACSSSSTPEAACKQYLQNVQKGNWAAVVDQLYFSEPQSAEDKEGMVSMLKEKIAPELEKEGGLASFEIGEVEMAEDGQKAKVKYTLHFGDGSEKEESQGFILVDGKWMINSGK